MAKTQDFTAVFKDVIGAFPVDTKALEDAFKNHAALNEKMSSVALTAAEKSAELSSKWTQETIAKVGTLAAAKTDPAEYAKSVTDFASTSAESVSEHMAAFAEIAKKVQMETVELMLAAGKDFSAEATANVQKATTEMTAAAKKATDDVTAAAKKATAK